MKAYLITAEAREKAHATQFGVTLTQYRDYIGRGLKHCGVCQGWLPVADFGKSSKTSTGLSYRCRECNRVSARRSYKPTGTTLRRRPRRGGDKLQAVAIIGHLVKGSKIPRANALPCDDCGQVWSGGLPRHEYHHYLGYGEAHHLDVTPLCVPCHVLAHHQIKTGDRT